MYSILLRVNAESSEEVSALVFDLNTAGITEEDARHWRVYFEDQANVTALAERCPDLVLQVREEQPAQIAPVAADDEPVYIGSRFVVTAKPQSPPPDRLLLVVDSVTAFGTGRHETTQMVLELLETLVREGDVIFDLGCGSGILSEASRLLAPVHVIACDIDETAIRAVRSQFEFPVFLGSADAFPNASADLILANISKKALDTLAPEIKRVLKPAGQVILSGFLRENPPVCYQPAQEFQKGDWLCWLCTRDGISVEQQTPGQVLTHPLHWW